MRKIISPNQSSVLGTNPIVGWDQVSSKSAPHTESFLNGGQIPTYAYVSKGDTLLGSPRFLIKFWSEKFGPV